MPGTEVAQSVEQIEHARGYFQVLEVLESQSKNKTLPGGHHFKAGLLELIKGLGGPQLEPYAVKTKQATGFG